MRRHFMTLGATAVATLVFLLTLGAPQASADTAVFTITNSNLGSGFTGPFGTVTITLTSSTTASVTFQANDSCASCGSAAGYQFIDGSAADLNVNSTNFTASGFGVTQLPSFHTNSTAAWTTSSGTVDGFGHFNLQINTQDGSGSAMDTITFTLTNNSGTWSSAANVLSANGNGNEVATHIATCSGTPCTITNTGATTGFGSQSPSVPDGGATLMLLGGALVGLETLRRKFRV